ncbi:MAG: hypothetical protein AB8I08_33485 [Sandaracinaceae bacterium]
MRRFLGGGLVLVALGLVGCGPGVDRETTLSALREALHEELPPGGDPQVLENHNQVVEDARDGNIFLEMRRAEVEAAIGRGQECGTRDLCARGGFEADDWVYEVGQRDGVPWGPTLILGFDRQGIVEHVYSLTRR